MAKPTVTKKAAKKKTVSAKKKTTAAPSSSEAAAVSATVEIEACKSCQAFKKRATGIVAVLLESHPDVDVTVNAVKPRKGTFEVRVKSEPVLSLVGMARPFKAMKALDMDDVAADVKKALDA